MCINFEAIGKDRAFLLDLPEPDQLEFPESFSHLPPRLNLLLRIDGVIHCYTYNTLKQNTNLYTKSTITMN